MALSTISGPHTRDAPCLRAVSRVGTASGQSSTQRGNWGTRRTGARADHRGEKDAILERVGGEMGKFETFERARRGGTGQHDSHPHSDSRSHAQAQVHVDTPRAHPRLDPAYACLARARSPSLTPSLPDAPAAIGPYSQAIKVGDLVFISGCIPLDPLTMQVVEGGIVPQTQRALANLEAVLKASESDFGRVVKTTVSGHCHPIMTVL